MFTFSRVLAPTDFSPPSQIAVRAASELCEANGAALFLLHIAATPPVERFLDMAALPSSVVDEARDAWGYLERLLLLTGNPRHPIHRHVLFGDPGRIIPAFAREYGIDLIVLGIQGRTKSSPSARESVGEAVHQLASCPVLTIPEDTVFGHSPAPFGNGHGTRPVIQT